MTDRRTHWNQIYANTPITQLGWYEEVPKPSLEMIDGLDLDPQARILDAGAGVGTLLDHLLERGFANLVAVDLSGTALQRLARRLETDQAAEIQWVVGDLRDPEALAQIDSVDLWHDRAVLHFLTDEVDRTEYLGTLKSILRPGGHVIVAAFSRNGPTRCSGCSVRRYDVGRIMRLFGSEFSLVKSQEYVYENPAGESRSYVYALLRRRAMDVPA